MSNSGGVRQFFIIYVILAVFFGGPKRFLFTLLLAAGIGGWVYWQVDANIWNIKPDDPGYRVVTGDDLQRSAILGVPRSGKRQHWAVKNLTDEWLLDAKITCTLRWANGSTESEQTTEISHLVPPRYTVSMFNLPDDLGKEFGSDHDKVDTGQTTCTLVQAALWRPTGPLPRLTNGGSVYHLENTDSRTMTDFGVMCWQPDDRDPIYAFGQQIKPHATILTRQNSHDPTDRSLKPGEMADFAPDARDTACQVLRARYETTGYKIWGLKIY